MNRMLQFFQENMVIFLVIYSILFFLMGFSILLKNRKKSELGIARSLWLLAAYALSHGLNEFIVFVLRVKQPHLSVSVVLGTQVAELTLKAISFMFILWLGISLITKMFERYAFLKTVGTVLTAAWILLAVYALTRYGIKYQPVMGNLSRYMFAFPGFLMSGIGLLLHQRELEAFGNTSLIRNMKGLAVVFFCATFFSGMVANEPVMWPATVFNRQVFMELTGIPVIFFRSVQLTLITYFVIRIVDVFEVEREYRLDEALRQQVLMDERERIARELHDGIIQSIYSVGLKLEQAIILADKQLDAAVTRVKSGKDDLNRVIYDIRDYIQDLQPADFSYISLTEGISQLVAGFRNKSPMQIELQVEGHQAEELNIIQINNILQILRELLTNAVKHSRATKIRVIVRYGTDELRIRVSDDGVGFDPASLQAYTQGGERQGLWNIHYRAGMMQGTFVFHSAPGQGTQAEITVPYKKLAFTTGAFVEDSNYFKAEGY